MVEELKVQYITQKTALGTNAPRRAIPWPVRAGSATMLPER